MHSILLYNDMLLVARKRGSGSPYYMAYFLVRIYNYYELRRRCPPVHSLHSITVVHCYFLLLVAVIVSKSQEASSSIN